MNHPSVVMYTSFCMNEYRSAFLDENLFRNKKVKLTKSDSAELRK